MPWNIPQAFALLKPCGGGSFIDSAAWVLIDSRQIEAGDALDKGFRDAAGPEIEQFKREMAAREGAGSLQAEMSEGTPRTRRWASTSPISTAACCADTCRISLPLRPERDNLSKRRELWHQQVEFWSIVQYIRRKLFLACELQPRYSSDCPCEVRDGPRDLKNQKSFRREGIRVGA